MAILPYLKKSYRYDPLKDFTPVALFTSSWTVFAINPRVPAQTLPELVVLRQGAPEPSVTAAAASAARCTSRSRCCKLKTGIDIVHVPYRGGGQAATDAISGQIEMVSMGLASARVAEGGKLRVLAQTGPSRHPLFAGHCRPRRNTPCPTCAWTPGSDWWAPPNTPDAIVARLDRARPRRSRLNKASASKLAKIGCALAYMPRAEFGHVHRR